MRVERIGVHDSVAAVFPARTMVAALADLDAEVSRFVLATSAELTRTLSNLAAAVG